MLLHDRETSSSARAFVDSIDGFAHLISCAGDVVHASERALLGRPTADVVGRPFELLVPGAHRAAVRQALDAAFRGRDAGTLYVQLCTADGVAVDVQGLFTRLITADHLVLGVFTPRHDDPAPSASPFSVPEREINLTQRQLDVLRLFASGHTTKQVATRLDIAVKTVHNHLTTIYRELDARSLVQATMIAAQLGIVELPVPRRSMAGAGN
jgi:DNA-binding CsgD family transcriptional regulator